MLKGKRFRRVYPPVFTLLPLGHFVFFLEPEPAPGPVRSTAAPTVGPSATPRVMVPTVKPKPVKPYEGMYVLKIPSAWEWLGNDDLFVGNGIMQATGPAVVSQILCKLQIVAKNRAKVYGLRFMPVELDGLLFPIISADLKRKPNLINERNKIILPFDCRQRSMRRSFFDLRL